MPLYRFATNVTPISKNLKHNKHETSNQWLVQGKKINGNIRFFYNPEKMNVIILQGSNIQQNFFVGPSWIPSVDKKFLLSSGISGKILESGYSVKQFYIGNKGCFLTRWDSRDVFRRQTFQPRHSKRHTSSLRRDAWTGSTASPRRSDDRPPGKITTITIGLHQLAGACTIKLYGFLFYKKEKSLGVLYH